MSSVYPKQMNHPNYRKGRVVAVPGTDSVSGRKFIDHQGSPDVFPPVSVNNEQQEALHRATGYIPVGEAVAAGVYQRYPMWMKKKEASDMLAEDPESEAELAKNGYAAPGDPDPQSAERAFASPHVPGQLVQEFPMMVDGRLVDPEAEAGAFQEFPKWHEGRLFDTKAELEAAFPPQESLEVQQAPPALQRKSPPKEKATA